jgi:hypothetical protein
MHTQTAPTNASTISNRVRRIIHQAYAHTWNP